MSVWSENLPLDTLLETFSEKVARLPEADAREAPVSWKIAAEALSPAQEHQRATEYRQTLDAGPSL